MQYVMKLKAFKCNFNFNSIQYRFCLQSRITRVQVCLLAEFIPGILHRIVLNFPSFSNCLKSLETPTWVRFTAMNDNGRWCFVEYLENIQAMRRYLWFSEIEDKQSWALWDFRESFKLKISKASTFCFPN